MQSSMVRPFEDCSLHEHIASSMLGTKTVTVIVAFWLGISWRPVTPNGKVAAHQEKFDS